MIKRDTTPSTPAYPRQGIRHQLAFIFALGTTASLTVILSRCVLAMGTTTIETSTGEKVVSALRWNCSVLRPYPEVQQTTAIIIEERESQKRGNLIEERNLSRDSRDGKRRRKRRGRLIGSQTWRSGNQSFGGSCAVSTSLQIKCRYRKSEYEMVHGGGALRLSDKGMDQVVSGLASSCLGERLSEDS
jgi:hypothetical protein